MNTGALWRGAFGITLRRALAVATWPALAVAVGAVLLHRVMQFAPGPAAPAAATAFLAAPLGTAAACCTLAALQFWPLFALDRPGRDTVRRLARGPFGGRGAAILGAITAQLALSLPIAIVVTTALGAPAQVARRFAAEPPAMALLDARTPTLRFVLPPATIVQQLWLRPLASLPTGADRRTRVQVSLDDAPLPDPLSFEATMELRQLHVSLQPSATITVQWLSGDLPLWFARGSVEVIGPPDLPRWGNAALAVGIAAAASLLAMLLGGLCGLACAGPTTLATTAAALFVQWVGGAGPLTPALQELLRGHWLGP